MVDLGIDVPARLFIENVKEPKPDIVGMSGVLTLSPDSMKRVVDELHHAGVREGVKVIIGGNPVNEEACRYIGANAYSLNAAEGIKICQGWMKR